MGACLLVSLMKSVFFLVAIAAPLLALAEPGDSAHDEVVRRQPGSHFLARSGISPSAVSPECQSVCTPIFTTLDACNAVASCECTQPNLNSLGDCLNCLEGLGPQFFGFAPAQTYGGESQASCDSFGFVLNAFPITVVPTGIENTGNPFSLFGPTPTSGGTNEETAKLNSLLPTASAAGSSSGNNGSVNSSSGSSTSGTRTSSSGSPAKTGRTAGLSSFLSLNSSDVGAVASVAIFIGGFIYGFMGGLPVPL